MAVKKSSEPTGLKTAKAKGAKTELTGVKAAAMKSEISYTKAFNELQKIVAELESEEVEIDTLVSRLKRAGALLQICKSRLSATEAETEKLLAEIVE